MQRGFTLVEMMVTLALVAIVFAMALPSAGAWIANSRIRNAAESLANGLQQARAEAVRRNRTITFWVVRTSDVNRMDDSCVLAGGEANLPPSWVVSVQNPAGNCGTPASNSQAPMIVSSHAAGDGSRNVAITTTPAAGNQVTFDGFGQVTNAGALTQIDVRDADNPMRTRALRLMVGAGGQIRVCDPAVPATDARRC